MTIIRLATPRDALHIAKIHVVSWQKIYQGLIPNNILDQLSVYRREQMWLSLLEEGTNVFIIEDEDKPLGFASICSSRDLDTDPNKCGEISAIYLHPNYWHKGFGKQLCTVVLAEMEKDGYEDAIVWVLEQNNQARRFYEFLGFGVPECFKEDNLTACELKLNDQSYDDFEKIRIREVRYRKKL